MTSPVPPELSTASVGSSQAPTDAVDNSAPCAIRPESTYKSGKVVQICGATSVAQALAFGGRLDIFFNNAGITQRPTPLHMMRTADWDRVLAVNLNGAFYCAREALKVMVMQGSGKLINIASIWGMVGSSRIKPLPAYTASKGAVVNLTRELGLEYGPVGINVNAICPGFFATGLGNGAFDNPDFVSAVSDLTVLGRVGQPQEMKGAAIFLASAASDYMCGQILVIDGGVLAH